MGANGLKTENYMSQDDRVKQVPYPIDIGPKSIGYGFFDLKEEPERAFEIVEAQGLPELQRLLQFFASPDSPFFSIGCEKAVWEQGDRRFSVRGYVEFSFNFPTLAHFQNYETLQLGFDGTLQRAKISGLRYFDWKVSPIDVVPIKSRIMACTIWTMLSDQPSKELAAKRYDKALGLLASYLIGFDYPAAPQGQIFGRKKEVSEDR